MSKQISWPKLDLKGKHLMWGCSNVRIKMKTTLLSKWKLRHDFERHILSCWKSLQSLRASSQQKQAKVAKPAGSEKLAGEIFAGLANKRAAFIAIHELFTTLTCSHQLYRRHHVCIYNYLTLYKYLNPETQREGEMLLPYSHKTRHCSPDPSNTADYRIKVTFQTSDDPFTPRDYNKKSHIF